MENFESFKDFAINPEDVVVLGGEGPGCEFPTEPPFVTADGSVDWVRYRQWLRNRRRRRRNNRC